MLVRNISNCLADVAKYTHFPHNNLELLKQCLSKIRTN